MMPSLLTNVAWRRSPLHQGLVLLSFCLLPAATLSQVPAITATADVAKTGAAISTNIDGQFLEHGEDIVNAKISSERLVDRKFFYPVATAAPTPAMANAAGNPRLENLPKRWWAPGGSGDTMDDKAPYAGDQSPAVRLSVNESHGLRQCGLSVRSKKTYSDRILLASTIVRVAPLAIAGLNPSDSEQNMPFFSKNLCFTTPCHKA